MYMLGLGLALIYHLNIESVVTLVVNTLTSELLLYKIIALISMNCILIFCPIFFCIYS